MKTNSYIGKKVRVVKVAEDGKESNFHEGIVVGETTSFLKIYDGRSGGDLEPDTAQQYPINAKRMYCQVIEKVNKKKPRKV